MAELVPSIALQAVITDAVALIVVFALFAGRLAAASTCVGQTPECFHQILRCHLVSAFLFVDVFIVVSYRGKIGAEALTKFLRSARLETPISMPGLFVSVPFILPYNRKEVKCKEVVFEIFL